MSWGSTAFTPIVTRNEPPFGFHEVIMPTDFKRCNEDPYIGTELLKAELNARFRVLEKLREERTQRELSQVCRAGGIEAFETTTPNTSSLWKLVTVVALAYLLVKFTKQQ